jgi:hypothetical protein
MTPKRSSRSKVKMADTAERELLRFQLRAAGLEPLAVELAAEARAGLGGDEADLQPAREGLRLQALDDHLWLRRWGWLGGVGGSAGSQVWPQKRRSR